MESFLENLFTHNICSIYTILFVLIFLENTVPFVPGDTVLLFSAYLSGRGTFYPLPTFIITVLGALTGFIFVFLISNSRGDELIDKLPFRISPEKIRKYRQLFQKRGSWTLVIARMLPGSRLIMAATAGFMNISVVKATILTAVGIFIWNGIIFRAGILVGENWHIIKRALSQYSSAVNIIAMVLLIIVISWKWIIPKLHKRYE